MHRSRVSTILIDAPADQAAAAADFWSAALGVSTQDVPGEPQFTSLPRALPGLTLAVQSVDDAPRYHVDIETDDLDAETARLTGLGAVEVSRWLDCRTLRAPGGHLLCVIPRHSTDAEFDANARPFFTGDEIVLQIAELHRADPSGAEVVVRNCGATLDLNAGVRLLDARLNAVSGRLTVAAIEFARRPVDFLSTGLTALLTLTGPTADGLSEALWVVPAP